MKKNVGNTDRFLRVLIAIIIGVLYYTKVIEGTLAIVLLVVAGISILVSLTRFCPLYTVCGLSTCKKTDNE